MPWAALSPRGICWSLLEPAHPGVMATGQEASLGCPSPQQPSLGGPLELHLLCPRAARRCHCTDLSGADSYGPLGWKTLQPGWTEDSKSC